MCRACARFRKVYVQRMLRSACRPRTLHQIGFGFVKDWNMVCNQIQLGEWQRIGVCLHECVSPQNSASQNSLNSKERRHRPQVADQRVAERRALGPLTRSKMLILCSVGEVTRLEPSRSTECSSFMLMCPQTGPAEKRLGDGGYLSACVDLCCISNV